MMNTMNTMTKSNQSKVYKTPIRKCVATGEQLAKGDLIRIVKNKDGEIFIDPTGKQNGRGAYLKKSLEAVELAKKRQVLKRSFSQEIPESIFVDLMEYITNE